MIRFNVPPYTGRELDYIKKAVENQKICGDGEFTKKCNEWIENKTGTAKALLTTSCTHATEMAAILCDIKPGDEIIMPSYTFVSTADAFVLRGAKAVFVDIRPDTMNMDENLIEAAEAPSRARKVVEYGDIIYSTVRPYLHNVCIIDKGFSAEPIASTGFAVFSCYEGVYNKFLFYYLLSPSFDFYANSNENAKGVAYPAINDDRLYRAAIPLPPIEEQHRIVVKIEELLPYVDRYAEAYGKLEQFNAKFPEEMKKAILQAAIQGKLVEQRPEEGTGEMVLEAVTAFHKGLKKSKGDIKTTAMEFELPDSWCMVELNQIFEFVDYRGKTPIKSSKGVFLITASNIKQGFMDYTRKEYISHDEFLSRQSRGLTQKGDLLFTTEAPMGNAALCDLDECSCGQRIITFKEYKKNTVSPALFMYFILSPSFQQQLVDNCTGTTAKGIKADKLKHLLLPLPPYAEQKRIVAKLEELLPYCEELVR